jgi:DNA invertase Pin-like site-specific DNA recombinase
MARKGKTVEAIGYMRTSSAANVGNDKDSEKRQRDAIASCAKAGGLVIVDWFYDAAVSGADLIEARPGFAKMLDRIAGNGVRTIVVETANRFARDIVVQETGYRMLKGLGVELIAADKPDSFLSDEPTPKMVRQLLGVVSEFEKAALVAKLKAARDRKKASGIKCGGRKSHAERDGALVTLAKALSRQRTPILSLREIAAELARQGHLNINGRPYAAASVKSMLSR